MIWLWKTKEQEHSNWDTGWTTIMKIHCGASTHQTSTKSKVRHFAQTHCLNPLLVNRERQALPQGDGCYWSCAKRHNLASCLGLKLTINAEKQQSDLCDTWLIPGLGSLKNSLFPNSLAVSWLWRCYSLMETHTGTLKAAGTTKKKLFVPLVIPNLRLRWEMQNSFWVISHLLMSSLESECL